MLNDQLVVMLPPAVYALCAGCAPLSHSVPEAGMNWVMVCLSFYSCVCYIFF